MGDQDRLRDAGVVDDVTQTAPPSEPETTVASPPLTTVASEHYAIAGEHGRGGIGRVLRAEDRRLGRPVAVKELLGGDPASERRFLREARLTARLQHPAIVPIYEAGRWPDGRPFYSMRFINGRSLKQMIDAAPSLDERLALLPNIVTVAEAIAYAHGRRVIHRDLKPNNVIVGDFGETIVIDWGLAKALDGDDDDDDDPALGAQRAPLDATMEGALLGTPAYMAPEQARGLAADERTDVYALGALLYTVVAAAPPYGGMPLPELLEAVAAHQAPPIRRRAPSVPPELAAIIDKAMAADPHDRYRDAGGLVRDLKRFLAGQLVDAHRYSPWSLAGRWMARHRTVVSLSSVFLVVLCALGAWALRNIVRERDRTRASYEQLVLERARGALTEEPAAALAWLEHYAETAGDWQNARAIALRAIDAGAARHVFFQRGPLRVFSYNFSDDGRRLVGLGGEDELRVWDVASGATLASVKLDGPAPFGIFFCGDDTIVLWTGAAKIGVWRIGAPVVRWLPTGLPAGGCLETQVSDGRSVLVAGGHEVREVFLDGAPPREFGRWPEVVGCAVLGHHRPIVDVQHGDIHSFYTREGKLLREWHVPGGAMATFSGDDSRVMAFGRGALQVIEVDSGREHVLPFEGRSPIAFAISTDGKLVVGTGWDRAVRLWDVDHGTLRTLGEHNDIATAVVFTPDGQRIISGGRDHALRVWNLDGQEERSIPVPDQVATNCLQTPPDGKWVGAIGARNTIRLWPLPPSVPVSLEHEGVWIAQSGDGNTVAQTTIWGQVVLLDVRSGRRRASFKAPDSPLVGVALSPDGEHVAWWSSPMGTTPRLGLWDTSATAPIHVDMPAPIAAASFAPDGSRLIALLRDGQLMTSRRDGAPIATVAGSPPGAAEAVTHRASGRLALVAGGTLVASNGGGAVIDLFDWAQGTRVRSFDGKDGPVTAMAVASDGSFIAATSGATLRLWRVADGSERSLGLPRGGVTALALSPDGRLAALAGDDANARVIDLHSGKLVATLSHDERVTDLVFSPDGTWLATGSNDSAARLWSVADWSLQRVFAHEQVGGVRNVRFSVDGQLLFWTGMDIGLRSARVPPRPDVPSDPAGVLRWVQKATSAVVAPGQRLQTP